VDISAATAARDDGAVPSSVLPLRAECPALTGRPWSTIRVLIVHPQRLVRAGIAALLEREDGIEVIGEAGSGEEAFGLARRLRPDVVLADVELDRGPAELVMTVKLEARQRRRRRQTLRLIQGELEWNSVT
jgi:Response regulator receiver domain